MCQKQTNYRKSEIVKYLNDLISIIYLHFFPNFYGFSYFLNKSQTHYYGVKISKGLNTPDIHGTTLLVWALSMILEIIDGPFDPVGLHSGNHLSAGLERCFSQVIEIVNGHLNQFTVEDILEIENPKDLLAFEI